MNPLLLALLIATSAPPTPGAAATTPHAAVLLGADLSGLEQVEAGRSPRGGAVPDAMALLRSRGYSAVRLRVWHAPARGDCDLAATVRLARRATALGMAVLLDLHESDTWADPGHQARPAAWAQATGGVLEDSVRCWSREVVRTLREAGVAPRWVQVGNEVTNGMLWPEGRVTGPDDREGWRRFAHLFRAGAQGVRQGMGDAARGGAGGPAPMPRILVHFDDGGDPARARAFAQRLLREGADFDGIGVSYYPWWHGPLDSLTATLRALEPLGKELYVLETAYPWTLGWLDDVHNVVGEERQLLPGYPATPAGQQAFLAAVRGVVGASPRGAGVFYWGAADLPTPARGSAVENLALFDAHGAAHPAPVRSTADTLTVVTLNIWHDQRDWPRRLSKILAELRRQRPDVVCLQEVLQHATLPNQAVTMAESLGWSAHFVSVDAPDAPKRYGNAILTPHPVLRTDGKFLLPLDDYRVVAHVRLDVRGRPVDVYDTHLHHTLEGGAIRAMQVRDLLAFVDSTRGDLAGASAGDGAEGALVLAGDFNTELGSPELAPVEAAFTDAYAATHPGPRGPEAVTLNERLGNLPRAIDHIFVPRGAALRPLECAILFRDPGPDSVWASDHFGVVARFVRPVRP